MLFRSVAQSEAPSGPRGRGGAAPRQNPARTRERISQSVQSKNVDELVDALAIHCEVPVNAIKGIIQRQSDEGMLILGKASGIGWQELKEILLLVLPSKTKTPEDVKSLFESFVKVTPADAQRAIRFIRTSQPKHGIN